MIKFVKFMTHLNLVLSFCFIVLWILDFYNPLMNLMNNAVSGKALLLLFSSSLFLSLYHLKKFINP